MGYRDQAKAELERLVKLQPADKVSASILKVLNGTDDSGNMVETPPAPDQTAVANTQPQPADAAAKPADAAPPADATNAPAEEALVGKFVAKPSANDTITLELGADKSFKWSVATGSQAARGFTGKFEYQDGVLALLSDQNGQRLVGKLTKTGDGQFNFKVVDGPEGDNGLSFSKSS
jgi:hypothetical protein